MTSEIQLKKEALANALLKQGCPSKTQQAHEAKCNINNIMAEFQRTGIMPHLKDNPGNSQINPSNGLDYHQAISLTRQQQQSHYDGSFQPDIKPQPEYTTTKGVMPFKP